CPIDSDAAAALEDAAEHARNNPLTDDGGEVTPAMVLYAAWLGLREPHQWQQLATAIDQARQGRPNRLVELVRPILEHQDRTPPTIHATLATICTDPSTRLPPARIGRPDATWRARYPGV